ncbi:hypothetical protein ES703_78414 [subsurface metagenome]
MEAIAITILVNELRPMGILFSIEVPEFQWIFNLRQQFFEHLNIGRVLNFVKFSRARMVDYKYAASLH